MAFEILFGLAITTVFLIMVFLAGVYVGVILQKKENKRGRKQ